MITQKRRRREISKEKALQIKQILDKKIKTVGVFTDKTNSEIKYIADYVGLDVIQLHGDQDDDDCKKFKREVWKSISIKNEKSLEMLDKFTNIDGFLFDSYIKGIKGGSGARFDWDILENINFDKKVILAGGLDVSNALSGIKTVKPDIVDVSSGVENEGGKDEDKIKEFIRSVRNG